MARRLLHWQILDRRTNKTQTPEITWTADAFKVTLDCHRKLVLEIGGAVIDDHFAEVMKENFPLLKMEGIRDFANQCGNLQCSSFAYS